MIPHQVNQGLKLGGETNQPVHHRGSCDGTTIAAQYFLLPIQEQCVTILGDYDIGEHGSADGKLGYRVFGQRRLFKDLLILTIFILHSEYGFFLQIFQHSI